MLDELAELGLQSDERFAHSLLNRRGNRYGWQRIAHELRQHGVAESLIDQLQGDLIETEYDRAEQVWKKKYDAPPRDTKEYARQYRFMTSRGFGSEAVRRLLGDLPS